jgi:hypothetical protein
MTGATAGVGRVTPSAPVLRPTWGWPACKCFFRPRVLNVLRTAWPMAGLGITVCPAPAESETGARRRSAWRERHFRPLTITVRRQVRRPGREDSL